MNQKGRVIHLSGIQSGVTAGGKEWTKQEFTIQFGSTEHPESMTITAFPADKAAMLFVGAEVEAWVNFRSKEYNGRWFNGIDLWKVEVKTNSATPMQEFRPEPAQYPQPEGDGLPF